MILPTEDEEEAEFENISTFLETNKDIELNPKLVKLAKKVYTNRWVNHLIG